MSILDVQSRRSELTGNIFPYPPHTRLFDIPVYRTSPESWQLERSAEVERWVGDPAGWPSRESFERSRARWHWLFEERYGEFGYNQIMGWLQVVWVGPIGHIKCYYYRVSTSRIGRHFRQGRYREYGKVADFHVGYHETSEAMMAEIRSVLLSLTKSRGTLRGRYLDLEVFDALAPFLDLRKLLHLDQPEPSLSDFIAAIREAVDTNDEDGEESATSSV